MHAKRGYILFLLFTMLSVCSVLISLYFSKVIAYRQLIHVLLTQEKANRLAYSSNCLFGAIFAPKKKKPAEPKTSQPEPKKNKPKRSREAALLSKLFPYQNKFKTYELTHKNDGIDATIQFGIQCEQGKLNLNSLFDFETKKFIDEGQPADRKKLCVWLFEKIATFTKKPSLFPVFEKHLASRTTEFNEVTELMSIKEFAQSFENKIFLMPDATTNQIYLTDIFTVSTEQDSINPWLFSPSWCTLLDLKPKTKLPKEELKKIFLTATKSPNWNSDWDKNLKTLYQKEFKDLAQEIKSILTTQFEANIFSLLIKANIAETNSTILSIVKTKQKDNLVNFEVIKSYQI